jgi:hypothetical protein
MRLLTTALVVSAGLVVMSVDAQERHTVDVQSAIEQGLAGKTLEKKCSARGENGFDLIIEGPTGRIMRAARQARKDGRPFGPADVTGEMAGPFVTVLARRDHSLSTRSSAEPQDGVPGAWVLPPAAEAERAHARMTMGDRYRADIVIKGKKTQGGEAAVLQPTGPIFYTDPVWSTGTRSRRPVEETNMAATFDLYALERMPAGDVQVVAFMTDAGERTCTISAADRAKIR